MANQAVLTVAAICTATLAQADTFVERWPLSGGSAGRLRDPHRIDRTRRRPVCLPSHLFQPPEGLWTSLTCTSLNQLVCMKVRSPTSISSDAKNTAIACRMTRRIDIWPLMALPMSSHPNY